MSPGINKHGSQEALWPIFTCYTQKAGLNMPVAHPGCPEDHFQTYANRSPGDLINDAQISAFIYSLLSTIYPSPFIHLPNPLKNSPLLYATFPPVITISGNTAFIPSYGVHPALL